MRIRLSAAIAAVITLTLDAGSGARVAAAAPAISTIDRQFMIAALQGGAAEIDLARLALSRGHAGEVLQYANMMIAEHPPLSAQLLALFRTKMNVASVTKHSVADDLALAHLRKLPPVQFDQEYLLSQVGDHLAAVMAFEAEAKDGSDPQLVAAARKALPLMNDHLQLAVDAVKHIGGSSPFKSAS